MLSLHSYLIYCSIYAAVIILPGPGVMAIVARSLGSGFRSCIPAALGTALGDLIWMTLGVAGLSLLAQTMGQFFLAVKLAGSAYLVYMGYKFWVARVNDIPEVVPVTARQSFVSQLVVTLSNPKAMAFFVAALSQIIDVKHLNPVGYLQLVIATLILIPSIMLAYAALAHQVRSFLTSVAARKGINKTAAVVIAGSGVWMAVSE
jgi:threonine/homoserine/homoserine lactone efflux protein